MYAEQISVFISNAGKYGPEKLRIRRLFTQCILLLIELNLESLKKRVKQLLLLSLALVV